MKISLIIISAFLVFCCELFVGCGGTGSSQSADTPLPPWPAFPTLSDPLLYPSNGAWVPDAVEFQFNPTLKEVKSIRVVEGEGSVGGEILSGGSLSILESGVCFRFSAEGQKAVEVRGVNHMGQEIFGQVAFLVQGVGASVKTCTPWAGGRRYALKNPFWTPGSGGTGLPSMGARLGEGPWDFAIRFGNATWPKEWTRFAASIVLEHAQELLSESRIPSAEVARLCPGYASASREQKSAFWALFIGSVAYPESGFSAQARFREPPPLSKWSEGLLQLSTDDFVSHGSFCDFMSEPARILKPLENIRCGVVILRNQVLQRKTLWPKTFYYWSVLTTQRSRVVRDVFYENARENLGFCNL